MRSSPHFVTIFDASYALVFHDSFSRFFWTNLFIVSLLCSSANASLKIVFHWLFSHRFRRLLRQFLDPTTSSHAGNDPSDVDDGVREEDFVHDNVGEDVTSDDVSGEILVFWGLFVGLNLEVSSVLSVFF